ncbi:hypothetical protein BBK36DRAFT_1099804, partial [Trichoderma citrinoviride]
MSRLLLLTGLLAASVAAQADHAAPGFKYIGCVEAEPPAFSSWKTATDLPASFSAEQCQHACHEKGKYAALDGAGGCRCYLSDDDGTSKEEEPKYNVIDESVCQIPCAAAGGFCGGPDCPVTGKKRYSLYKKEYEDDACEEEHGDDKNKDDIGTWNWNNKDKEDPATKTTTEIKTITSCPPEVTDCPLRAHDKGIDTPPFSPITKHQAASSAEPATPSHSEPAKPECDGEHCKKKPECDGEHCKITATTAAAPISSPPSWSCPPGGPCVKLVTDSAPTHPRPTNGGVVPTKVPVTISGAVPRYEA